MSLRNVQIALSAVALKLWLWLNLAIWRVDYVEAKVIDWATPKWTGGYRGWLIAAQYFAAYRFKHVPMKRPWYLWLLNFATIVVGDMALRTIMPHWATIVTVMVMLWLFISGGVMRREMYKQAFATHSDSSA